MRIVIIANFPARLDGNKAKGRFLYLGEMLCNRGHYVEMIISDFVHESKEPRDERTIRREAYKTKITMLHEPGYPNNVSPKRLWSHFVWGRNVEKYLKTIEKPDIIYSAIPSLTANVRAAKYCEKNNIRFIIDIQDLWPEAFVLAIKNKVLQLGFKPLELYVNQIYKRADNVIAVSETYANRVLKVNKKTKNGISVYLGNDGALFDEARDYGAYIEKSDDELLLCYIGTMGYSYDIPCVLNALHIYGQKPGLPPIRFVAMGDGPLLEDYKKQALSLCVNCDFTGRLPYNEMVSRMCKCDIAINPIVRNAAQSITNKVGDYALSGLPVVSTQENLEYRNLVESYNCGINCTCGNANDVADALTFLANNATLRKKMGNNARRLGVERFDRRITYNTIVEIIENCNLHKDNV